MELTKEKDFEQEVELKNLDPEIGFTIRIDPVNLEAIETNEIRKIKEKTRSKKPEISELSEAEDKFHDQPMDFNEDFGVELNFDNDDILPDLPPESTTEEILKLLAEETEEAEEAEDDI